MNDTVKELTEFLDQSHSVYHASALLQQKLQEKGYTMLAEGEQWLLEAGGKYCVVRSDSSLIAFRIPGREPAGFLISASHSDRPTFKVKENGELVGQYTRLATEKYGGMILSTWLDRPLSVAGRVMIQTPTGIQSRLVDVDRDLLLIPNVAIHMNRKVNEGYAWNPAVDTLPLLGSSDDQGKLWSVLEEMAGGKILGHDLYLYVRQKASVWGIEEQFLSAPALDDLSCAWCCAQGFLNGEESGHIPVLCVFDSEEVGSSTAQGAGSDFLESALQRICNALDLDRHQMLSSSFLLSVDNAHAVHPNHPEYSDAANAPVLGKGVVLKFNANQRYTTDGASAAVLRSLCQKADVPVQTYYNRADLPGGSTLGCISLSHVSVLSADIGLAQLAMHSCYETVGVQDVICLQKLMRAFYSTDLHIAGDGNIHLQ